jgi:hypothetical protein
MNMDNYKSYEFTFLYLINKCILLFKYIENTEQKNILNEIKNFISKLQEIFSTNEYTNSIDKKNKILEILIDYFEKLINERIYDLINDEKKDDIISNIEHIAFTICEKKECKEKINSIDNQVNTVSKEKINVIETQIKTIPKENISPIDNKSKILPKEINTDNQAKTFIEFEKKINNKIITLFNEIENNIKTSLKKYIEHTQFVEYDLD